MTDKMPAVGQTQIHGREHKYGMRTGAMILTTPSAVGRRLTENAQRFEVNLV